VEVAAPEAPADGVLVVDKPAGPTSFDVVRRVRRALRARRAGHTGTLDPLATGLLAVCVGEALKLQQFLVAGDKAYQADVEFGSSTDSGDAEGAPVERADAARLSAAEVEGALPALTGEIEQVPPMFSAIRVGGRRLHEAARSGETVERAPRRVRVHEIRLLDFRVRGEAAVARLLVRCGKGTYVRALAVDLGRALGLPAHLAALRRTEAGPFTLGLALALAEAERLGREDPAALRARLVPPADAVGFLPAVRIDGAQAQALRQGRVLRLGEAREGACRALDGAGGLVAVCRLAGGDLHPVRVLAPQASGARR
jgi:tRNA pseudouridine55 synthase